MAAVNKINATDIELHYAEETTPKVLPATPVWRAVQPNTVTDFGGNVAKTPRKFLQPDRQRRKGQTTDLDAAGTFNHDLVQEGLQPLMQGFMFADFRYKPETAGLADGGVITSVGSSDDYTRTTGSFVTDGYLVGDMVFASGFTNSGNNGLKTILTVNALTLLTNETLTAEASPPAAAKIVMCGVEFGLGDLNVDISGDLPALTTTTKDCTTIGLVPGEMVYLGGDAAINTFTETVNRGFCRVRSVATNTITLDKTESTMVAEDAALTVAVIAAGGTTYAVDDVLTLVGGTFTTAATCTVTSVSGGVVDGISITEAGNYSVEPSSPVSTTVVPSGGTGCTITATFSETTHQIRLFAGRVLKNETGTSIVRRTYNVERQAGAPDDALPAQIQSEYLTGAVPSELTWNVPTADLAKVDVAFMAMDHEQRTGAVGIKSGTRVTATEEEAYNTSSNVPLIKISTISATDANPTALFAFAQEVTLVVNNNITLDKAVGTLGAFDATHGTFDVNGNITAYFSDVAAVSAVRNNSDITLEMHLVRSNQGISLDVPLMALGDGRLNVEIDQAITLPLSYDAATGASIVSTLNHTLLMVFWDYLPTAAGS